MRPFERISLPATNYLFEETIGPLIYKLALEDLGKIARDAQSAHLGPFPDHGDELIGKVEVKLGHEFSIDDM